MKRFRRRKSIKMILALAVVALALVPVAQARQDMYPGAQQLGQGVTGTIHGVPTTLYQRLPVEDQAALAGTGSIGGYATSSASVPTQQVASTGSGFAWSAAGIGAGFAVVMVLAILCVAVLTRNRGLAQA
jgi:hypothetical protein